MNVFESMVSQLIRTPKRKPISILQSKRDYARSEKGRAAQQRRNETKRRKRQEARTA